MPIRNIKGVKNPDLLINTHFVEIKNITGNLKAVGKNFRNATKQADNIVLSIQNENLSINDIRNKIYGEIKLLIKDGKWDERKPKFLIVIYRNKIYSWSLSKGVNANKKGI